MIYRSGYYDTIVGDNVLISLIKWEDQNEEQYEEKDHNDIPSI